MRRGLPLLLLVAAVLAGCGGTGERAAPVGEPTSTAPPQPPTGASSVLKGTVTAIDGATQPLDAYLDKVVLVVNTASRCGYTPQYEGLQELYETYGDRGFTVLGFPSNDFQQELDTDEEIKEFCSLDYGVTFPLFSRTSVIGADANPLFAALARQPEGVGAEPTFNFTKYLLDRNGMPVRRWDPNVEPTVPAITNAIEALLRRVP